MEREAAMTWLRWIPMAVMVPGFALAQSAPLMVDSAEIYCTDAARPGFQSLGVTYSRTMPNHFSATGLKFCRLDMLALAGPSGNAEAGWRHDGSTGVTSLWCNAHSSAGNSAEVRVRFALYGHPAGSDAPGCLPVRAGRIP
jgi:hypothetical protein